MDHSLKLWNKFLVLSKPNSSINLLPSFPSKLSLTTNHLLENVALKWYKTVQMFGGFWMIMLPWDARNTICLALLGYFSQKHVLRNFFRTFVFFEIVSNIFENI